MRRRRPRATGNDHGLLNEGRGEQDNRVTGMVCLCTVRALDTVHRGVLELSYGGSGRIPSHSYEGATWEK